MARGEAAESCSLPKQRSITVRFGEVFPPRRMRVLRLDLARMTERFLGFLRTTRNASVSWPPEQTASNALDARRAGEEIGQKVFDARDEADVLFGQMPRSLHRAKRL
ncbi:MAG: hypothetical protein CR217_14800 [Beijerinckiaceae bacterium]|nr:MAG: hypothetical protein CR217_14800 [Beijerinckiaceae bacterium]